MRSVINSANNSSRRLRNQQKSGRRNKIRSYFTKKKNKSDQKKSDVILQLEDRVRIAGKYTGTVKFIGRLESETAYPEIFVGIHLDEQVTKNSGVFHNRQYFDCPYGYGIMVPYVEVKKLRPKNSKSEITQSDFERKPMKQRRKIPYSIRRWKNTKEAAIPEIIDDPIISDVPVVKKIKGKGSRQRIKKKPGNFPSIKKKPHAIPTQSPIYIPPIAKNQTQFDYTATTFAPSYMSNKVKVTADRLSRVMPDPYPSRSALQQSFAMIADSAYSSADSCFGEYATWKEREDKGTIKSRYSSSKHQNSFLHMNKAFHQSDTISHDHTDYRPGTLLSNDSSSHRSWTRINNVSKEPKFRRIACPVKWSFDPDDYEDGYYTRGAQQAESGITFTNRSNPLDNSSVNSTLPRQRMYQRKQEKRSYSVQEKSSIKRKGRDKYKKDIIRTMSQSLSISSDSLNSDSEENGNAVRGFRFKQRGDGITRARSYAADLSKSVQAVSTQELQEWRKKFGKVEASQMMFGLQKLQDAFFKGMDLTGTQTYTTPVGH